MDKRLRRRTFLGCCGGLAAAAAADTLLLEPSWLSVTETDVPIRALPPGMDGLRIAHLSDLHLARLGNIHEAVISALARFDPQLVVITGDAVEGAAALPVLEDFARLLAAPGRELWAVAGNWERWGHVPLSALESAYRRVGARLLVNEAARSGCGAVVVGVDDHCTGNDDVKQSLRDAEKGPLLLLTHAPGLFDAMPAEMPEFALALSGHTHGGQVCAFGKAIWTPPGSGSFVAGMYQTQRGPLYVSRGIGTSVLAARFTCRPELALLRLRSGAPT